MEKNRFALLVCTLLLCITWAPSTEAFGYTRNNSLATPVELHGAFKGLYHDEWIRELLEPACEDTALKAGCEFEKPPEVPIVVNKQVRRFIKYFQAKGRPMFSKWLKRGEHYMPMLKRILKEHGLPEDLVYLALIESGFNPRARSRARAVGMWQFISGTGKKYGLRVDWWIDERRDPEKATHAAARYLTDLYERFGSWYLAGAGYNAGEGRIAKAIRKHNSRDFWVLASSRRTLKRETRHYIPKYLAAMLIAKDPALYGFDVSGPGRPVRGLAYDKVRISRPTDIKVIARAAGTTAKEIKTLNPALKRWFTPPEYPDFEINIPVGTAALFKERIARIARQDRLRFHTHRIKRGETLSSIARKYRTRIKPIMYLNNIKNPRRVRIGTKIVVPIRQRSSVASRTASRVMPSMGIYIVKKGDTLWDISIRFGVKLKRVREWNGLGKSNLLHPGQRLIVKETSL